MGTPKNRDQGLIKAVTITATIATTLPVTRDNPSKNIAKTTAS